MATLHLDKAIRHEKDQTVKMLNLPDRFIWDTDSTGTFLETLKSEEYKTKVEGLLEKEDLKVEDIKDLLIDTANTSRIRKTKKSHRKKTDKTLV